MNNSKSRDKIKSTLLGLGLLVGICSLGVLLLKSPALRTNIADYLSFNTFYAPSPYQKGYFLDGNQILNKAFFGQAPGEPDEPIIILPNSPAPHNSLSGDKPSPEGSITEYEQNKYPEGKAFPIINCDISTNTPLLLNNTTSKNPDTERLLMSIYDFGYDATSDEPLVLVIHTHATECYSRESSTYFEEGSKTRTVNEEVNMVAVGKVFSDTLEENGIPTLHCTVQHDAESYSDSYSLAAASIREYIKKYPSIKYVFDLHRDAIVYESGAKARPVSTVDNKEAAQIMFVSGTDAGGADFPHWQKNLSFTLKLCEKLIEQYPTLVRTTALRGASYNQQYTEGSVLVEIGSDGNTLSQAKYSAELLANTVAKLIKGK